MIINPDGRPGGDADRCAPGGPGIIPAPAFIHRLSHLARHTGEHSGHSIAHRHVTLQFKDRTTAFAQPRPMSRQTSPRLRSRIVARRPFQDRCRVGTHRLSQDAGGDRSDRRLQNQTSHAAAARPMSECGANERLSSMALAGNDGDEIG